MQGTVGESAQQQSSDVFSFQTAVLEWGKKKKRKLFIRTCEGSLQ